MVMVPLGLMELKKCNTTIRLYFPVMTPSCHDQARHRNNLIPTYFSNKNIMTL